MPASSARVSPVESREIELVEKLSLRFVSAPISPPTTLQTLFTKFLTPLLLKLGSPHASVREKTRQTCAEAGTRLRSSPEVGVPVEKLVLLIRELAPDAEGSSRQNVEVGFRETVRETAMVFACIGLSRLEWKSLDGGSAVRLIGLLLQVPKPSIPTSGADVVMEDTNTAQDVDGEPFLVRAKDEDMDLDTRLWVQGFSFLLIVLPDWVLPERQSQAEKEIKLALDWSSHTIKFLSQWFTKFLLADSKAFDLASSGVVEQESLSRPSQRITVAEHTLFGNWAERRKQTAKGPSTFEQILRKTKVATANFLFLSIFTDEDRFVPAAIMGADDTHFELFRVADTMSKQCNFDFENERLIDQLFVLYFGRQLGELPSNSERDASNGNTEEWKIRMETTATLPAPPKLRMRLLSLLSKSKVATTRSELIIRMVEEQFSDVTDFGREATKLRNALLGFLHWCHGIASRDDIAKVAPSVLQGNKNYVVNQGWPNPSETGSKNFVGPELDMRSKAYENIGTWAARTDFKDTEVWGGDEDEARLNLVKFLFTSLRCDSSTPNIHLAIESALGSFLNLLDKSPLAGAQIRTMLMENIESEVGDIEPDTGQKTVRSTKFAAIRFVNRCLPFDDSSARWMNLMAIGAGKASERHELAEEGSKGLDPHWWSSQGMHAQEQKLNSPPFDQLVSYIFGRESGQSMLKEPRGNIRHALPAVVLFSRNILFEEALSSAGIDVPKNSDWGRNIDTILATNEEARAAIRQHTTGVNPSNVVSVFDAALKGASLNLEGCAKTASSLCSILPQPVIELLFDRIDVLKELAESFNTSTQQEAARILGIVLSHPSYPQHDRHTFLQNNWREMQNWRAAIGEAALRTRGRLLSCAWILGDQILYGTLAHDDELLSPLITLTMEILLQTRDQALRTACHSSIRHLMLCLEPTTLKRLSLPFGKVIKQLRDDAKKEQESAVLALGSLLRCITGSELPDGLAASILEASGIEVSDRLGGSIIITLYSLHDIKRPEMLFAIGEALTVAVGGWHSKATITDLDVDFPRPDRDVGDEQLQTLLNTTLEDVKTTKPSLKRAGAIWLLSLVQFLGTHKEIQNRLGQCQVAFASLLSEREEIVQETGSRGLGLVYEMGDKNIRDDLVRDLVTSFTSGNAKMGGTVTSDTELFEQGTLPTGDGSVSTYKDIMSLASEMGDPSLVYRFMNLASSNAIWSSRSAFGRFGLGSVLAESTYLTENKNFYPKLYRYRFDPNPNVQKSMNDIWSAVVKDSNSVIDQNFDLIIEDLLRSIMAGREWRVRQASCAAIADLIQGRDVEKYEKYLDQIWTKAFKVLDDIKETVRVAAMTLCRTLTNLLIRNLEVGDGMSARAQRLLDRAIPFLLDQLRSGSAQEVQEYAIKTLLKIIKKSPAKALQKYAPIVMETLINALSSFEHEAVNYIHMNADKYGMTAEKLDGMRVSGVSSSPAMRAIERCLEALDDGNMAEAMDRLRKCFKSVIGLPSKIGLSSVLVSLTVRHQVIFRPHADRFVQLLRKHLLDRNETITNSNCLALAYLVRLVSDKELEQIGKFVKDLYFTSEDTVHRQVAGEIILAISKTSNDRFMSLATEFLPFAFVARNDMDSRVRESFTKAWEDNIGGSRAVLLYFDEIVALGSFLDSPQWGIKHSVASSVADLVTTLDSALDSDYSQGQATAIWKSLEKALAGKTWEGKETVVDSFPKFVKKTRCLWETSGDQFGKIALREARRNNAAYQKHSIPALGEIAKLRENLDLSRKVLDSMSEIVDDLVKESDDRMDVDDGKDTLGSEARRDASLDTSLSVVIACCFKAVTISKASAAALGPHLYSVVEIVQRSLPKGSKKCQLAFHEGVKTLFDNLAQNLTPKDVTEADIKIGITAQVKEAARALMSLALTVSSIEADATETIRTVRAQSVLAFGRISAGVGEKTHNEEILKTLRWWLSIERSSQVQGLLRQAQDAFAVTS